ncbi:hypothetical protein PIB30_028192 [Stylosanthes scabra]|uniref:Uncharacterized protein n=1 Tax=Stylosanthes scabra TaxID=79078 RepID=A0ABU6RBP3_9FABA|nr:hypothetical protein [Stylosanthes scabra]
MAVAVAANWDKGGVYCVSAAAATGAYYGWSIGNENPAMWNRFTWGWSRFTGLEAIEGSKSSPSESILLLMESIIYDRGRLIGPPGKYEQWSSDANSGSVELGYNNRPSELVLACRI